MKDYRKKEYRWECLEKYYVAQVSSGDIDPAYGALNWLFDHNFAKTREQRFWRCFLYGVTYCVPTVFYITSYFPDLPTDFTKLELWHKDNWGKLHYGTDRRYCKGHLVEMAQSYRQLVGGSQTNFFKRFTLSSWEKNFERIWIELQALNRFGRYSLFYYTETLARCMGLQIECKSMMFGKDGKSHTNGMLYALGLDHMVDGKWSPKFLDYLERHAWRFIKMIDVKYPIVPADPWYLETSLCAFKGLFRERRYMGYYNDCAQHQILRMQERTQGEVDMFPLWTMRKAITPHYYLGEVSTPNGTWDGPRKELLKVFVDTGQLVDVGYYFPDDGGTKKGEAIPTVLR